MYKSFFSFVIIIINLAHISLLFMYFYAFCAVNIFSLLYRYFQLFYVLLLEHEFACRNVKQLLCLSPFPPSKLSPAMGYRMAINEATKIDLVWRIF